MQDYKFNQFKNKQQQQKNSSYFNKKMNPTGIPQIKQRIYFMKPLQSHKVEEIRLKRTMGRCIEINDM